MTTPEPRGNGSRCLAVGLLICLWLGMCALEVSPQLHNLLHQDAQSPAHNCLVTQLQHQLLLAGLAALVLPVVLPIWSARANRRQEQLLPSFDFLISDGRAPPRASSSTAAVS